MSNMQKENSSFMAQLAGFIVDKSVFPDYDHRSRVLRFLHKLDRGRKYSVGVFA